MFRKTYQNTIKNLFRSPLFLISLALVIINAALWANNGFQAGDNEDGFLLGNFGYLNSIAK